MQDTVLDAGDAAKNATDGAAGTAATLKKLELRRSPSASASQFKGALLATKPLSISSVELGNLLWVDKGTEGEFFLDSGVGPLSLLGLALLGEARNLDHQGV